MLQWMALYPHACGKYQLGSGNHFSFKKNMGFREVCLKEDPGSTEVGRQ